MVPRVQCYFFKNYQFRVMMHAVYLIEPDDQTLSALNSFIGLASQIEKYRRKTKAYNRYKNLWSLRSFDVTKNTSCNNSDLRYYGWTQLSDVKKTWNLFEKYDFRIQTGRDAFIDSPRRWRTLRNVLTDEFTKIVIIIRFISPCIMQKPLRL